VDQPGRFGCWNRTALATVARADTLRRQLGWGAGEDTRPAGGGPTGWAGRGAGEL